MLRTIRHTTQQDNGLRNDCAWACMRMLVEAYSGRTPTLEALAMRYGVPHQFTTIAQLVGGLNAEGIAARHTTAATWAWYREQWDAGVPVIALLAMHEVADNDGYEWAHFAVTTGVGASGVSVFNPLKRRGPTLIPTVEFQRAITARSRYTGGTNAPAQAVYPLDALLQPTQYARDARRVGEIVTALR